MTKIETTLSSASRLGSVDAGHLVVTRGASHLTIGVDGSMDDLYRARFDGKAPDIALEGGTLSVRYRPSFRPPQGEITLSGRVPWEIECRSGMSHVVADLEDLELLDLRISGGSSNVEMRLPRPSGTVRVKIGGGASDVEVTRPAGVPVRVRVGGGVSDLTVDDLELGSDAKTDWHSPDYDRLADRYDVEIGAGVSKLTIARR